MPTEPQHRTTTQNHHSRTLCLYHNNARTDSRTTEPQNHHSRTTEPQQAEPAIYTYKNIHTTAGTEPQTAGKDGRVELVEPDPVENTGSIYSHLMEETRPQTQPCAYTLHHNPVPTHHSRQGQQGGCAYHTPPQARTAPDHRRQGKHQSKGDGAVSGAKVLLWLCRGAGRGKPDIFADKTQKKFSISLRPRGILKDYCYEM